MAENSSTSYGLTPNTTGNGILPEIEQIIVVDFRQWYQHGFEYVINGYVIPIWTILNMCIYFLMVYVFLKNGMTTKSHISPAPSTWEIIKVFPDRKEIKPHYTRTNCR
jgi:hypothetical protein